MWHDLARLRDGGGESLQHSPRCGYLMATVEGRDLGAVGKDIDRSSNANRKSLPRGT